MNFVRPPTENEDTITSDGHRFRLCPCGSVFEPYRDFQHYCSDECRIKYNKGKVSYYIKKSFAEIKCKECGKLFRTNNSQKHYCSNECYLLFQSKRHVQSELRKCFICGKEFETTHWAKRYCSTECRMQARKEST